MIPQLTVLGSFGLAVGIIYFVHHSQNADRKRMRQGVEQDIARQTRKEENRKKLEEQLILEENLKKRDEVPRNTSRAH